MNIRAMCAAFCAAVALTGCTNTIKYDSAPVEKAVVHDIGVDALQQSTTSMINAMVNHPDIRTLTSTKRPVVAVLGLVDLTGEGVNIAALNSDIMLELTKSDRFRFADSDSVNRSRQQLGTQLATLLESPQAGAPLAKAVNADYLVVGEVSKIIRTQPTLKATYYRVSLKLVDPTSSAFTWEEIREFLKSQKKIIYGV